MKLKKILFFSLLAIFTNDKLYAQCPAGKVEICHNAGNACVTMCVPTNAVAAHLAHGDFVGSCNGGQIFGLLSNSSILDFASIDVLTGSATVLSSTNIATTFEIGTSTFDPINKKYFFTNSISARPINEPFLLYQIDIPTLNTSSIVLAKDIIEFEYDISTNNIWGLSENAGQYDLVEINVTGTILNSIPTGATSIGFGTSTFDKTNRRYFFENSLSARVLNDPPTLYKIDVNTTIVTPTVLTKEIAELEYDENSGGIWGLRGNSSDLFDLVEIDISGNILTTIPVGAVCIDYGSSTFSQNNRKYFFKTTQCSRVAPPARHYSIDVTTGTVLSSVITGNTIEYEFYSCAAVCPTCKKGNSEQEAEINVEYENKPSLTNYSSSIIVSPHPFSDRTNFTYFLAEDGNVTLEIFDLTGKSVAILLEEEFHIAGVYEKSWTIENKIPSGLYFYKLKTATEEFNNKMVIIE